MSLLEDLVLHVLANQNSGIQDFILISFLFSRNWRQDIGIQFDAYFCPEFYWVSWKLLDFTVVEPLPNYNVFFCNMRF